MGRGGLSWWLAGYVRVEGRAVRPAALFDRLLADRVALRDGRVALGRVHLCLRLAEFRRVRPAARAGGARLRIVRRAGLPVELGRLRRRPVLVFGALFGAAALYVLSSCVWFVQIQGVERLPAAEVRYAAAQLGVRPGVWRASIDAQRVARRLPMLVPDLAWAAVRLRGTLATVQVMERLQPAPAHEQVAQPGDIVAAHAGVVSAIEVQTGQALVHSGDRVQAGQVLIQGIVPMAPSRTAGGPVPTPVHAAGTVIGRTWLGAYAEASRTVSLALPDGHTWVRHALVVAGRSLPVPSLGRAPRGGYHLERRVQGPPTWRGLTLPVQWVTQRYVGVTHVLRRLSVAAAGELATASARAFLLPHLSRGARVIAERASVFALPGDRVGVELLVESEDNIGVFRPLPAGAAAQAATGPPAVGR